MLPLDSAEINSSLTLISCTTLLYWIIFRVTKDTSVVIFANYPDIFLFFWCAASGAVMYSIVEPVVQSELDDMSSALTLFYGCLDFILVLVPFVLYLVGVCLALRSSFIYNKQREMFFLSAACKLALLIAPFGFYYGLLPFYNIYYEGFLVSKAADLGYLLPKFNVPFFFSSFWIMSLAYCKYPKWVGLKCHVQTLLGGIEKEMPKLQ